jgi:hypothetical protein
LSRGELQLLEIHRDAADVSKVNRREDHRGVVDLGNGGMGNVTPACDWRAATAAPIVPTGPGVVGKGMPVPLKPGQPIQYYMVRVRRVASL